MNHVELKDFFNGRVNEYAKIETRIAMINDRIKEVVNMEDDSMIQLNMSLTIFSVSKLTALSLLREALDVENNYLHLMYDRFDSAVGIINGDLDAMARNSAGSNSSSGGSYDLHRKAEACKRASGK